MIAETAHVLHTPISDLLEMEWRDVCAWHDEAARIMRAKRGK